VPTTEIATWTRVGPPADSPQWVYLQSAAFDETRKVLVMSSGLSWAYPSSTPADSQELWEWNPATGTWTNRTSADVGPSPRAGASLVFDSLRNKFVIFGGHTTAGDNLADIWDWDPGTGVLTDRTTSDPGPSARGQQAMVFEKSTGKVLLFGGGLTDPGSVNSSQGTGVSLAFGDTWEWNPATGKWTKFTLTVAPSARHASAMIWDATRARAVLFGGMEKTQADLNGIPKQDTWEWDPSQSAWSNRTATGTRPSPRYAHAMAYDPVRGVTVLVGGWDIETGNALADVWEWNPTTGAWTQRLTGNEANLPQARMFASLVTDSARNLLDLVGGLTFDYSYPPSGEIWDLDPNTATFTDRTPPPARSWPSPRSLHAMAFCPASGKTYVFGGVDDNNAFLDDLWEWDGTSWSQIQGDVRPAARMDAAMACDPFRKSLILYGGMNYSPGPGSASEILGDTWEWNFGTRKWSQLHPASRPEPRDSHAMVTDTVRGKVLLFGGERPSYDYVYPPPGSPRSVDPLSNAVWEWDGANTTWTNRNPVPFMGSPVGRTYPILTFDEARQKLFLLDEQTNPYSTLAFWEWDPVSAGWELRDAGDMVPIYGNSQFTPAAYDSLRRRQVVPLARGDATSPSPVETWELDTKGPTWYQRILSTGPSINASEMTAAFDSQRGVVVLFGGWPGSGGNTNDTWEYKVTNLANGEGCTAATASTCASGFCVDGVCCAIASCSGSCQSCAVPGREGTCVRAAPGTEVPGSCADLQACDGSGGCKKKNGVMCLSASVCASGFCADGVCCDNACDDTCVSCNLADRAGKCSAYDLGSDPERECGVSFDDPCTFTCSGTRTCDTPQAGMLCGTCATCDGAGTCLYSNPAACGVGDAGAGGAGGTGGTGAGGSGGAGGSAGAGGFGGSRGGAAGRGGTSGTIIGGSAGGLGGSSGSTGGRGGAAGTIIGSTGGRGGTIGTIISSAGGGTGGATIGGAGGRGGTSGTIIGGAGGSVGGGTGGASGSLDGGGSSSRTDAGSSDGGRDSIATGTDAVTQVHRSGCRCDLGQTNRGTSGLTFALIGAVFLWRRRPLRGLRRPQVAPTQGRPSTAYSSLALVALLLLTACAENDPGSVPRLEPTQLAMGPVPATESATWTRLALPTALTPQPRYLQSAAFDESRRVLVMFGGLLGDGSGFEKGAADIWEWDPATGAWTNRTPAGVKPSPRGGAGLVYDSTRKLFLIFGGRSSTGYDFEDTWEWDPGSGAFTDHSTSGPSARSQHSMVFEKSTGNVLLFGGGLADSGSSIWPETLNYADPNQRPGPGASYDGTGISLAFGDTWEWNPATGAWTQLTPASAPSARYDSAMVWDSKRNCAVLFGGMKKPLVTANGLPQQDVWEWDPATPNWTLRTTSGNQPSPRWGHAMAYDSGRGMTVLTGGKDFQTYLTLADVWDWNPATAAWTQRLTGSEANLPAARMYASLVTDSARTRLEMVSGITLDASYQSGGYQLTASQEIWDLEPASATFTDRSPAKNSPSQRWQNAMAFCPATGKTYVFGGWGPNNVTFDDLWEWDGTSWSQVKAAVRPSTRADAAMAYDPFRKSLILFGGISGLGYLCDTWEWQSGTRAWRQLFPKSSPACMGGSGMITDSGRAKVLLFGGEGADNTVWEWDGAITNWTNRTPIPATVTPGAFGQPPLAFDDGRQKMFLFWGQSSWQGTTSNSVYWEWDPVAAGWAFRDSGDFVDFGGYPFPVVAYDSLRRRLVFPTNATETTGSTTVIKTWELDSKGPTWYLRDLATGPTSLTSTTMAFDSQRGVMVLFGAGPNDGAPLSETWEYKVTSLGNGAGCTAATASTCLSGFCVDGVCCSTQSCSGMCQSCNVAGRVGTCALVTPGTEVSGSCADGQACATTGVCLAKNGTACSAASTCASRYCTDGVCCESACNGTCLSCNQANRAGKCSPYPTGIDPQNECGLGSGACRSTCNGAGACDYPQSGSPCGPCQTCDGNGMCQDPDPYYCGTGGFGGGGAGGGGGTGGGGAGGSGGVISGGVGGHAGAGGSSIGGNIIGGAGGLAGAGGSIIGGAGGAGGLVSGGAGGLAGAGGGSTGSIIGGTGGVGGLISGGAGGLAGAGGGTIVGGAAGVVSGGAGGHAGVGGGTVVGGAGGVGGLASGGASGRGGAGGTAGAIIGGAGGAASSGAGGYAGTAMGGAGGASGGPDSGSNSITTDTGSVAQLRRSGCDCDLGQTPINRSGLPFALLGAAFLWRRLRRRR
jgi:hypothetical protein